MLVLSQSSATTEPLTVSNLRVPVFCMVWVMPRALSRLMVVGPVPCRLAQNRE